MVRSYMTLLLAKHYQNNHVKDAGHVAYRREENCTRILRGTLKKTVGRCGLLSIGLHEPVQALVKMIMNLWLP